MAKYIPYKNEKMEWEDDVLYQEPEIKKGPILSSYTLQQYIRNNWLKIKERRRQYIAILAQLLDNLGPIDSFEKRRDHIYILTEMRWNWDKPTEKENILLCTQCMEWDSKDSKEFEMCWNNVHTIHKNCVYKCLLRRLFNDGFCDHTLYHHAFFAQHHLCLICHPLFGEPIGF